jgi:hypothetical protein
MIAIAPIHHHHFPHSRAIIIRDNQPWWAHRAGFTVQCSSQEADPCSSLEHNLLLLLLLSRCVCSSSRSPAAVFLQCFSPAHKSCIRLSFCPSITRHSSTCICCTRSWEEMTNSPRLQLGNPWTFPLQRNWTCARKSLCKNCCGFVSGAASTSLL